METIIDIPIQFKLRFVNSEDQFREFLMFPNGIFICPHCNFQQGMMAKEGKMKVIEFHSDACKYVAKPN